MLPVPLVILPAPPPARPILGLSFVHVKDVVLFAEKFTLTGELLHTLTSLGFMITGFALIVTRTARV
jgi:hypothetical protein